MDYGLLAGLGEGLKGAYQGFTDSRDYEQKKKDREEDRKYKQLQSSLDLASKGYQTDPNDPTGSGIIETEGFRAKQERESFIKELHDIQKGLIDEANLAADKGVKSPDLSSLLQSRKNSLAKRFPSLFKEYYGDGEQGTRSGLLPQAGGAMSPASMVGQPISDTGGGLMNVSQQPGIQAVPGFRSKEEKSQERLMRGLIAREEFKERQEQRKQERESRPENVFKKMGVEGKQKLGFITGALQNLTDYDKAFSEGGRQKYLTPQTPILGLLKSSTPIDDARVNLEEAIGRLASGGAINTSEESRFRQMIPKASDKDDDAKRKLSLLRREFENKLTGYGFGLSDLPRIGFDLESRGYGPGKEKSGSGQDAAALEWAKANPKDPRAKKIMQLQGR